MIAALIVIAVVVLALVLGSREWKRDLDAKLRDAGLDAAAHRRGLTDEEIETMAAAFWTGGGTHWS